MTFLKHLSAQAPRNDTQKHPGVCGVYAAITRTVSSG